MVIVKDLMTAPVISVEPTELVTAIADILKREGIRQVVVVEQGRVIGIVTQRDVRAVRWASEYKHLTAKSIMTRHPIIVTKTMLADKAVELLNVYRIDALPVVEDGALVGIVTTSDVLDYFSEQGRRERAMLA